MSKRTYQETATDYELWCEYVDPDANMTQEEFDRLTTEQKVEMQIEMFGAEESDDDESE